MSSFVYPRDLVPLLKEHWQSFMPRQLLGEPLPSDDLVELILETAYHASFTVDESRRTKFTLTACRPSDARAALILKPARAVTVHEVMRLAPAVPLGHSLGIQNRSGRAEIWGLLDSPTRGFIQVTADAPGSLRIHRANLDVCVLRNGAASTFAIEGVNPTFIAEQFPDATRDFVNGIDQLKMGNAFNRDLFFSGHWHSVLTAMASTGHGGTLFVIPHQDADRAAWKDLARVKYGCDSDAWARYRATTLDEARDFLADDFVAPQQDHAAHYDATWFEAIPSLSRVDGGVLLTDRFRVLGFGVEVLPKGDIAAVKMNGKSVSIDDYGTRHRTAARFCQNYPGAVAFVCSQDGGIKCMRSLSGEVHVWT